MLREVVSQFMMLGHYKYLLGNEWVNWSSHSFGTALAVHRGFPGARKKTKKPHENNDLPSQDFENLQKEKVMESFICFKASLKN